MQFEMFHVSFDMFRSQNFIFRPVPYTTLFYVVLYVFCTTCLKMTLWGRRILPN